MRFSFLFRRVRFLLILQTALSAALAVTAEPWAEAAIPPEPNRVAVAPAIKALSLPVHDRLTALRSMGPRGYKMLRTIMFDPTSEIEMRWRATLAVGRLGRALSIPELERAKSAESWELRTAALFAVARFDRDRAAIWARELLKDKALLVRLSAVQAIQNLGDREAIPLLWSQLESQTNFRNGQSLFIRKRIVETLSVLEGPGSESHFVALLDDRDSTLHEPSVRALERLTGHSVGGQTDGTARRRALWQQWWSDRTTL